MRRYTQLTREQRYQIYALKKAGHSQNKIALLVEVHKSTISRELKRNTGQRGYRPKQAHWFSQRRDKTKRHKRIELETWLLVESRLKLLWSPEQISGWLRRTEQPTVSHERIYQ